MKITQRLGVLLFLTIFLHKTKAQIGGVFGVPNDFPTIAAAVNTLNLLGVAAPVTINVAAGYTETATTGGIKLYQIPGASSVNQVIFRKNGSGANPILFAFTGTCSSNTAVQDGIWWMIGTDYLTIDGIDIFDPNTTSPATMEFGFGFYKASTTNGCQYNTIKNCVITLKQTNNAAGSTLVTGGSRGIDVMASNETTNWQTVITNSITGTNSYNKFYSNVFTNCHIGIALMGYMAPSPYIYADQQNDIGGFSSATSNTFVNFGGGSSSDSYGVRTQGQNSLNVSNNYFNNQNGSGTNPSSIKLTAIRIGTANAASSSVNSNTIVFNNTTSSSHFTGIHNQSGNSGSGNVVNINDNVFPSFSSLFSASNASLDLIMNDGIPSLLNINNNFFDLISFKNGSFSAVRTSTGSTSSISSNTVTNVVTTSTSSSTNLSLIEVGGTSTETITNNYINNVTWTGLAAGMGTLHCIHISGNYFNYDVISVLNNTISNVSARILNGIFCDVGTFTLNISNNQLTNLTCPPSTGFYGPILKGINVTNSSSALTVSSNVIYSLTSTSTGTSNNTGDINGIDVSNIYLANITKNKISSFYSTGYGRMRGIKAYSGTTYKISNNVIGDLSIPNSAFDLSYVALAGIELYVITNTTGISNVSYNSVNLNCVANNPNFSSCAFSAQSAGPYILKNNIFVNTSVSTGTGISTAFLNSGSNAYTFYNSSSNNNLFYVGTPASNKSIFMYNATNLSYSTTALFKAYVSPRESQSISENPPFVNLNPSSSNYLDINPLVQTQIESGGVPISGITDDYAGTLRNATTPDIGAWEGNYTGADTSPPTVLSSGFTSGACNAGGRTYTVALSDQSGVATGSLSPRLYYRVNFTLFSSVQGTLTAGTPTNGVWSFNMTYNAVTGNTIFYFLAAQDESYLVNLSLTPSGGSATDVNTVLIPPSPASSYTVEAYPTLSVNSGSICSGNSFTIQPSGLLSYTYSGGSAIVSPSTTTNYSVIGTNSLGCNSAAVISSVVVNASPTITVNSGYLCTGNVFTIVPSGADSYTFSSGASTVNPLVNTSYSVTGTSLFGCVASNTAIANVSVAPFPIISVNSGTICSGSSYTILPTGASTYTYSSGLAVVNPSVTTSFSVVGTSVEGCVSSNTAISNVTVIASPTITVNSGSICSGGAFTLLPSGANSYNFEGGSSAVSPTVTKTYTVIGTNLSGCVSNIATSQVSVNTTPTISVNSGSICYGNTFTINPSGVGSYTISGNSATVSPTTTTMYLVTGTGTNGCLASNTATSTVLVVALPTISVNSGSICSGNNFTLVPSGTINYIYPSGSAIVSPNTTSTFPVSGSSAEGCPSSNTAIATVSVFSSPAIAVNSGTICSGETFTIIATGASTYSYQGGSSIVNPGTSTSYSVVGTSTAGCISNAAISQVSVNVSPTISVNSGSICAGNNFTINPSGVSSYTISGNSSVVSPSTNSFYLVIGTGSNGCMALNTATSSISVSALPTISVANGVICSGKSFTLSPIGATSYVFPGGSAIVSPLTNTTYPITGISSVGCVSSNTAIATLTVLVSPTITVNNGSVCAGEVFSMIPSGAISYTYSNGSPTVIPVSSISYSVIGTATNGCISSNTAVSSVTVNAVPSISVNSGSICAGDVYTITPLGANTYTFLNGTTTVSPVSNTSYSIVGTSLAGCVSNNTAVASVTVNALPVLTTNTGTICAGDNFTLTVSGANSYSWSSGGTMSNTVVNPLTTTVYSVVGTNTIGCFALATATVYANTSPNILISPSSASVCLQNSVSFTASGVTTYSWSSGSTGASITFTPTASSTYTVIGLDANSCVGMQTVAVTSLSLPILTISGNSTLCVGQTATLSASGASSYSWSSGSSTPTLAISPIVNANYVITGTNALGCSSSASFAVNTLSVPVVSISQSTNVVCAESPITFTASGASTYSWNTGSSNSTITQTINVGVSQLSVTGTNVLGCSASAISSFTGLALPNVVVSPSQITLCAGDSIELMAGGASTYSWSHNNSSESSLYVSPESSTDYTVSGIGANGCKKTAVASVGVGDCTGLKEQPVEIAIEVFPNPFTRTFQIVVSGKLYGCKIEIIDNLGRVLLSEINSGRRIEIDMKDYDNGLYYYKISKGNKVVKTGKVIKE